MRPEGPLHPLHPGLALPALSASLSASFPPCPYARPPPRVPTCPAQALFETRREAEQLSLALENPANQSR